MLVVGITCFLFVLLYSDRTSTSSMREYLILQLQELLGCWLFGWLALALSNIEAGRQECHYSPVHATVLLSNMVSGFD